jgi:DNA-binding Lrp family transcriptional regulator
VGEAKGAALIGQRRGIQSVEIGIGLLDALIRLGKPSSLSEIAKASGLSVSQAHRYLASFVNTGFLRQDSVSLEYDLHTGALRLGLAAMARMDVFEAAGRVAQLLVAETGRTILLAVWAEQGPTVVRWYPGDPPIYTTLQPVMCFWRSNRQVSRPPCERLRHRAIVVRRNSILRRSLGACVVISAPKSIARSSPD